MNKRMIENSARGLTIDKHLAWGMLVGILGGGIYVGSLISDISRSIDFQNEKIDAERSASRAREARIRALENGATQSEERVANMIALLSRIDQRLERIEQAQTKRP